MVAEIIDGGEVLVDGQFTVDAMPDLVKPYVLAAKQLLLKIRPFCGKRAGEDQFADKLDLCHFRLAEERLCLVFFHVMSKNCFEVMIVQKYTLIYTKNVQYKIKGC